MRLIKPSVEIWEQPPGMSGIYQQIERCARVCYKSEDKIGEGTAEKMVEMLKEREHTAMLEHGTVYLMVDCSGRLYSKVAEKYTKNKYSMWKLHQDGIHYCITTNLRVLVENGWLDDLRYLCEPTKYHEKRVTVHFTCDRGISHELVRHRVFSFAQESTRYCNYSKSKFNNEITFIIPCWTDIPEGDYGSRVHPKIVQRGWHDGVAQIFIDNCRYSEDSYFRLLNESWVPQQARTILPNSLKTEVCMTGFVSDWKHFFELRTAQSAHPQMRELTIPLKDIFRNKGLLYYVVAGETSSH